MIHVFKQEKSIWSGDSRPVDVMVADIILRVESIVSVESTGDDRCLITLSTGREIVLKNTYDEVYGVLLKANNKNTVL
jgi:hypothetical protein